MKYYGVSAAAMIYVIVVIVSYYFLFALCFVGHFFVCFERFIVHSLFFPRGVRVGYTLHDTSHPQFL